MVVITIEDTDVEAVRRAIFDEKSPNWDERYEYNLAFLRAQTLWQNDKLQARGYVFLNDVLDALGLPPTSVGQLVGWVRDVEQDVTGFIDFGVQGIGGAKFSLCFNIQGVIYDRIES